MIGCSFNLGLQHLTSEMDSVRQLTTLFPELTYHVLHIRIELPTSKFEVFNCLLVSIHNPGFQLVALLPTPSHDKVMCIKIYHQNVQDIKRLQRRSALVNCWST